MVIPQDIINKTIETVGDNHGLLKEYTPVSSSFLLPMPLLSHFIYAVIRAARGSSNSLSKIHPFCPLSGVLLWIRVTLGTRTLGPPEWHIANCRSLTSILLSRESLHRYVGHFKLEWLQQGTEGCTFDHYTFVHSHFYLNNVDVPIMLFQGTHLMKLDLDSVILDGGQSRLLTISGISCKTYVWIIIFIHADLGSS